MHSLPRSTSEDKRLLYDKLLHKKELMLYNRRKNTWVPLETGCNIAPAPATLALALAIDGSREPSAEAER